MLINLASTVRTTPEMQQAPALLAEAKAIVDKNPQTPPLMRATLLTELARSDMYTNITQCVDMHMRQSCFLRRVWTHLRRLAEACDSKRWQILPRQLHRSVSAKRKRAVGGAQKRLTPFNLALTQPWNWRIPCVARRRQSGRTHFSEILAESQRRNGELHVDTVHIEARLVIFCIPRPAVTKRRRLRESMLQKLAPQREQV